MFTESRAPEHDDFWISLSATQASSRRPWGLMQTRNSPGGSERPWSLRLASRSFQGCLVSSSEQAPGPQTRLTPQGCSAAAPQKHEVPQRCSASEGGAGVSGR